VFAIWLCLAVASVGCTTGSGRDRPAIGPNACPGPACISTSPQQACVHEPCGQQILINSDGAAHDLCEAMAQRGSTIVVTNNVELDLTACSNPVRVAEGVTLIGGRTAREPGPLLFSAIQKTLFLISENDVRISGLRIKGPDHGEEPVDGEDLETSVGIYIRPTAEIDHIEIDHNEIYGWWKNGIRVNDDHDRITFDEDTWPIVIHDNFIHNNQEQDSAGYGVVIGTGAYALIDRNVFDYNRHAIAGTGSDDSGYRATRNLVLQHGGKHKYWYGWGHTHQFDMHGQSCGSFCGTAGRYIDINHNSFLYTAGTAIKIRGTPQEGAWIESNVFAHSFPPDAVQQTPFQFPFHDERLYVVDNRYGIDGSDRYGICDFDGDDTDDRFMATGQTWWYSSGGTRPWVYLNTSQRLLSEVTLGDRDGDGRCDVVAGDLISSGGTSRWIPL
jgi:hypothetical protein